jgi:hypothetical protein
MSADQEKEEVLKSHPELDELLYSEAEVQARVQAIADLVNERYAGKKLIVVGILKGMKERRGMIDIQSYVKL